MINPASHFKATRGLIAQIARELQITTPAILKWQRVPAERVLAVERVTGIPREVLRPDLYLPPATAAVAA